MPTLKYGRSLEYNPDSIYRASKTITSKNLKAIDAEDGDILVKPPGLSEADKEKLDEDFDEFKDLLGVADAYINEAVSILDYYEQEHAETLHGAGRKMKKAKKGGLREFKSKEPTPRYYNKMGDFPYMTTQFLYGGAQRDENDDWGYLGDIYGDIDDEELEPDEDEVDFRDVQRPRAPREENLPGDEDDEDDEGTFYSARERDDNTQSDVWQDDRRERGETARGVVSALSKVATALTKAKTFFDSKIKKKLNFVKRLSVQSLTDLINQLKASFKEINTWTVDGVDVQGQAVKEEREGRIGEGVGINKVFQNCKKILNSLDESIKNAVNSYSEVRRTGAGRHRGGTLILSSVREDIRKIPTKYLL